jgi:hypothetical protein
VRDASVLRGGQPIDEFGDVHPPTIVRGGHCVKTLAFL